MKKCLLFPIIIFSLNIVNAQNTFQVNSDSLGSLNHTSLRDILVTTDGDYILCGNRQHINAIYSNDANIIKMDQAGEVVWSKSFSAAGYGSTSAEKVIETSDSGLVIFGTTDYFGPPVIIRTDKSGILQWSKSLVYFSGMNGISIVTASNGFVFLAGGSNLICITKIDFQGIKQWSYTYEELGMGVSAELFNIVRTNDDGYIICGQLNPTSLPEMFLMKIDSVGNVKWTRTYSGFPNSSINDIVVTNNGFIVCGYGFVANTEHTIIMKIDSAGNIQWHKEFTFSNFSVPTKMIQDSDGGFVMAYYGFLTYPLLVKTDSTGSPLWAKSYGDSSWVFKPWALTLAPDKGYVFGGVKPFFTNSGTYGSYFITKTNAQGASFCTEQSSSMSVQVDSIDASALSFVKANSNFELNDVIWSTQDYSDTFKVLCSSTGIQLLLEENNWTIYPNPFPNSTTINFSLEKSSTVSIEVFNLLGQKVSTMVQDEKQAAGKHQYTFSGKGQGIYFVKMIVDGKTFSQKIVCVN